MRASRKLVAAMLSVCMILSAADFSAYAQSEAQDAQVPQEVEKQEESQQENLQNEEKNSKKTQNSDKEEDFNEAVIPEQELKEDKPMEAGEDQNSEKALKSESQEQEFQKGELNFVMQENAEIQTPGIQNIAASLGKEGTVIDHASLCYRNQAGRELVTEAAGIVGNMVKFSMEFADASQEGVYELTSIQYQAGEEQYQVIFADLDMKVQFGVNQEVDAEPDEVLIDEEILKEVEASVVSFDEDGNVISENTFADAGRAVRKADPFSVNFQNRGAKKMTIMLDPGHDSVHAGARGNGCIEEELVLKIASYCRAELQKYSGLTVYMTRETNDCPNGGYAVDSGTCNALRVELAAQKKADVYVSFHLNSSVDPRPTGVGVYYPNDSYRPDIGAEGKGLAWEIFQNLSALGLDTWAGGILIRNSETNTLYPDGSLADYLGVIRRSKLAGFPAVLIEHAFLSSSWDANTFLSSEEKLKNLGVADAKGIASFYGLTVSGGKPKIESVQSRNSTRLRLTWEPVNGAVSYQVYRSLTKTGGFKKQKELAKETYDDTKAEPGVTYYYKVRAVFSDGKKSAYSAVSSGKLLEQPEITKVVAKSGKLNINWNRIAGAETYELLRSEASDGTYKKIATLTGDVITYTDKDVTLQKDYFYKLRARGGNKKGYSAYSEIKSGWAIGKTSISSVSSADSTSLRIKWKKVNNAYGYQIQRSTAKKGKYQTIATVKDGKTYYIDTNLKEKKTYYYKVQALNKVDNKTGRSSYCTAVSGKTITPTSMVYVKSKSSGSMELKWKKDASAYAYSIKRSTKKNSGYQKIAEIRDCNITQYIDKNAVGGKQYYYTVETIIDKKGVKGYSGDSKPKGAVNLEKVIITAVQAGADGFTVSWKKAAGANCYQIMRSTNENSDFVDIAKIGSGEVTSFTDRNVTLGVKYYYRIRAVREAKYTGYGSYGKVASVGYVSGDEALGVPIKSKSKK